MRTHLMKYTKNNLIGLSKFYNLKGYSKLNKEPLVEALMIQMEKQFGEKLKYFDAYMWTNFQELLQGEKVYKEEAHYHVLKYRHLIEMGLVFVEQEGEETIVKLADEVIKWYEQIDLESIKEENRKIQEWIQFKRGCIHLYGGIQLEEAYELFKAYMPSGIPFDEVLKSTEFELQVDSNYAYWKGYIFMQWLWDEGEAQPKRFQRLLELQQNKAYYKPSLKTFLKHGETNYVEKNLATKQFEKYMMSHYAGFSKEALEELVLELVTIIQIDLGETSLIGELVKILEDHGVVFENNEEVQSMVQALVQLSNHTRTWVNCGHTPNELRSKEEPIHVLRQPTKQPANTTNQRKVGRNEPCPCGSGKKYKKCCGR